MERSAPALSMSDYADMWQRFGFNGVEYVAPGGSLAELTAREGIGNTIVGACISVRALVFGEIRFAWQQFDSGRTTRLFGTPELGRLESPWAGATTREMLHMAEVDASLYGSSYWVRSETGMTRICPDDVTIVTGDVVDRVSGKGFADQLVGYAVTESRGRVAFFLPDEIAHYRPLPDPDNQFRGRSWLSAVLPDVTADRKMTEFKHAFLANAATPSLVITISPEVSHENYEKVRKAISERHEGSRNAFKSLTLYGGMDAKVVGADFEKLALKAVQGAGETRIAAAARVPATILGISEGLAGSSLNAGNYGAARRLFADGTMRPLWGSACGAFQNLLAVPAALGPGVVRLWYDERDVAFLQEDVLDAAEIRMKDASTMRTLVDGGFDPGSVVAAITSNDMSRLVHSGLVSVQLQLPGTVNAP